MGLRKGLIEMMRENRCGVPRTPFLPEIGDHAEDYKYYNNVSAELGQALGGKGGGENFFPAFAAAVVY